MTGWAMLCSSSVQEAHRPRADRAGAPRWPHESRSSTLRWLQDVHEVAKIHLLSDDVLRAMLDDELVFAHRGRALNPDRPVIRGVAQNLDVYFQRNEPFYAAVPRDGRRRCSASPP